MMKMRRGNKVLCILTAVCLTVTTVLSSCPEEIYGAGSTQAQYLESITINADVKSTYSDEGRYDKDFYDGIVNNYAKAGSYTKEKPLEISTPGQLAAFAKAVNSKSGMNFQGKYVKLINDIDLGGTAPKIEKQQGSSRDQFKINIGNPESHRDGLSNVWIPVGKMSNAFQGNFDGGGNTIQGMVVCKNDKNENNYAGFFGYTEGSAIRNLGIENACVIVEASGGDACVGGLVGGNFLNNGYGGLIENSYASGAVYACGTYRVNAGGLAGYTYGSIKNSYASVEVYAKYEKITNGHLVVGGLVGGLYNSNAMESCYVNSSVYAHGTYHVNAGMVAGNAGGETKNNYQNSEAKFKVRQDSGQPIIVECGTPLTRQEMTGTGKGRADEMMMGFDKAFWIFQADGDPDPMTGERTGYFPRLAAIDYTENSKPTYRKIDTQEPKITSNLNGRKITYTKGEKAAALKIRAQVSDGGQLSYQWYKSNKNMTTGGTKLTGETGTSYTPPTDLVGTRYYYCVVTNTKASASGARTATSTSNAAAVVVRETPAPAKPNPPGLKTSTTYKSVKLSWKKVKKAKGYQIYRASKKNGKYKRVKTTKARSWTNKKLTTGKTYYYKVRAYKKVGKKTVYGSFSKRVKAVPRTKAPKFTLKPGKRSIKVVWKKVKGGHGYRVYRARSKGGKYKMLKDSRAYIPGYTSIGITANHKYYYKLRSYRIVKGKKVYSAYTKVKTVKTK